MKLLLAIATSIFITRSVIAQTDQSFGVPANDLYCKNIKQKDSDSFSCVFLDLID